MLAAMGATVPMRERPLIRVMHVIQGADVRTPLGVRHLRRATPRPNDDLVGWYYPRYHHWVTSVEKIVSGMRDNPKNVHEASTRLVNITSARRAPPADPMPYSKRLGPATLA